MIRLPASENHMAPLSSSRIRLRFLLVAALLLPFALLAHAAAPAAAQEVRQIKLTEQQVQGFIAAQKAMSAVAEKIESPAADKPDPKIQAALEDIARKNGFKDYAEYDEVAANISMVMAGIDPQTREFTDAKTAIKKEIDEVTADQALAPDERKQMLEELNESLKTAVIVQNLGNVDVVRKYYDQIDDLMQ